MVGISIQVSLIALAVIFLVLSILIGVIQVLVAFLPCQEPPTSRSSRGRGEPEEEHLAAIQAALAHHLQQPPDSIRITRIHS